MRLVAEFLHLAVSAAVHRLCWSSSPESPPDLSLSGPPAPFHSLFSVCASLSAAITTPGISPPTITPLSYSCSSVYSVAKLKPTPAHPKPLQLSVCTSTKEEDSMLVCELCNSLSHCKCVKIPFSLTSTYPYVCAFSVNSALVRLSS